jgi:hypothetical protein
MVGSLDVKAADFNVSNLDKTIEGAETISGSNTVKQIASNFSTGSFTGTANVWLVQLYLNSFGSYDLANLSVRIFTDNVGVPGAAVGSFSGTGIMMIGGIFNFTNTASPVPLQPNTNYWLVIKNSVAGISSNNVNWAYDNSSSPQQGLNGQIGTTTLVNPNGSGWISFSSTSQLFTISSIPEPSTYALGMIGALTMGYVARRRSGLKP